ncbi:MAG: SsrA-binding protein SmpB [Candidatus Cloacimonetes bacterium]|nr:SsrA-binding protein SmpB [Candidatus Cloacimonadota bacterium]
MKIINKKARFDYEILESLEVGIALLGMEVKSVKSGRVNISDAFVKVIGDELWLVNTDITKYEYASDEHYDSKRTRKLLIQRKQLNRLESKMKQGNLTLIPLSIYTVRGYIKVEIGLARGKKYHEKRKAEKERDMDRDLLYESRKFVV